MLSPFYAMILDHCNDVSQSLTDISLPLSNILLIENNKDFTESVYEGVKQLASLKLVSIH